MKQLIVLVKPLIPVMGAAIIFGVAGYLCAIFLTILTGYGLLQIMTQGQVLPSLFGVLLLLAVSRGVFHYIEQYCNHFIAFKLLALIRHQVFGALRRLCPAKLESRQKGNLISIITSDIELLEVFYAHTISPIAIAFFTSLIMVLFIGRFDPGAGVIALCGYLVVGVAIPLKKGRQGAVPGMKLRSAFGEMNSFVLDSLRGLDETIQYGKGEKRKADMNQRSTHLGMIQKSLSKLEGEQRGVSNLAVLFFSFLVLFYMMFRLYSGNADFEDLLLAVISVMGSFGPVMALSNLSNNLNQSLASGKRVWEILEEQPVVEEVPEDAIDPDDPSVSLASDFAGAEADRVTFSYGKEDVLSDFSMKLEPGKIVGIHGASGSGKSTLLKLLMRFWDVDQGRISISGEDIRKIPTKKLRDMESYVTQETHLFHDTIANNIAMGKLGATRNEIVEAAKKASLHDFIMSLPQGYDTQVGELGDTLSGGERQRIGIARTFLHDAPFLLLDEPTSNLDALNEGIILKSLQDASIHMTVVLVSHRQSTMNIADRVVEM